MFAKPKSSPVLLQFTWLIVPALLWGALHLPLPQPVGMPSASAPCNNRLSLFTREQLIPVDPAAVTALTANGVLTTQVCQAGTLTFEAWGTPAAGRYPLMTVSLNGKVIFSDRPAKRRTYRLPIAQAGAVALAFHDDLYLPQHVPPEDRNLFIQGWSVR